MKESPWATALVQGGSHTVICSPYSSCATQPCSLFLLMWTGSRDWLTVNWCINHYGVVAAVVVQSLSSVQLFATPWIAARCVSLSFPFFRTLLKFMSTELVMLSNHLILCHCLILPSIFPGISGPFPNLSALHIRWLEYCSFNISPSNEYSGLITSRTD